jgi:superfamily II DNA or RNA helicase
MISRLVEDEERNEIIFREVVRVLQGEKLRDSVEGSCPKDKDQTNDLRSDLDLIKDPATENNCFAHLHCKQETLPSPHDSPRILLLNDRVESCKRWVHFLQGHGIAAGLMIGGPGNKDDLEETITGLRFGTLQVGVGTVVADEGLDIPPLTHVFITCPTHKHPKRMEQMLGRAARPSPGKDEAVCVYFWDCRMFPTRKKGESEAALALRHKKFLRELTRIVDSSKFIE